MTLKLEPSEEQRVRFFLGNGEPPVGESADSLMQRFHMEGIYAAMDATGGRGADFAANQAQGLWAESLLRPHKGPERFIPFGLSDPIDPGDRGYDSVRRKHRYILLVEGKRPDFLIFRSTLVSTQPQIESWSDQPLTLADRQLLKAECLAGAEIKSSKQHIGVRLVWRSQGRNRSNLSVTVKEEEFEDLARWQNDNKVPIVIIQVFVDAMYAASFDRVCRQKAAKRVRYVDEEKTGKLTCLMPIDDKVPRIADIEILEDGFSFRTSMKGEVTKPRRWPAAKLFNVRLPDLDALKRQHIRR